MALSLYRQVCVVDPGKDGASQALELALLTSYLPMAQVL